nr:heme-binding protein [Shewanella decolorationis]
MCVSVVDHAGLLVHFERMDNALLGAIDVAIKKARTAALFQTNSAELGAIAQPGGAIYTLEATNGGLISFGGGVILRNEQGNVIGAIGVAGATVEGDEAIAQLAARQ